jgi:hypothetical protein
MADLKPLGSEKLQGDDKLKRILELTYYGNKTNNTSSKAEYISESVNGVYGIVKEKDGYFVKKGLNESSLDYIGGLFMKNKNKFSSYAEALKRLDLLNGQEQLQEATKYVLKQNKTAEPAMPVDAPAPMPTDVPSEPSAEETPVTSMDDMGSEVPSDDTSMEPEMGTPKPSDYMAEVQKFAGKLGQELRDQKEKMESDDIKYVLNMIISAVDLNKLEIEDIEDIAKKFDRDEEDFGDEDFGDEEVPSEEPEMPAGEPESDEDLGEMSIMDRLESFVNMPAVQDEEIDLSSYADLGSVQEEDVMEIDLEEIKKEINRNIGETLGKYFK